MRRQLKPLNFYSGPGQLERDQIKLRLAVVRSTGISPESIKAMPALEFFILLDELNSSAKE